MTFTEYFEDAPQMTSGEKKKLSAITLKTEHTLYQQEQLIFRCARNTAMEVHLTKEFTWTQINLKSWFWTKVLIRIQSLLKTV